MKHKKKIRKVGPSGSVAGLTGAIDNMPQAPPANLTELLKRHRESKGQDKVVAKELLDSFSYLAYEKYIVEFEKSYKDADDLLGQLYCDLGTCIERLAKNDIPAEEVESYIKNDLFHSHKRLRKKDKVHLNPPPSTVADRKKNGLEPLPKPERVHTKRPFCEEPDSEFPTDPLEDPAYSYLVQPQKGEARAPSRFDQPYVGKEFEDNDSYTFLVDVLENAAQTPLEKTVAGMLLTEHSGNAIARSLKVPRKQITQVIHLLQQRVWERLHGSKKEQPLAAKTVALMTEPNADELPDLPVPSASRVPLGYEDARMVKWPEYDIAT